MIGGSGSGSGSGNNNEGGGDIQDSTYIVEYLLLVPSKRVRPSFSLVYSKSDPEGPSPMSEPKYHRATVFLMIFWWTW